MSKSNGNSTTVETDNLIADLMVDVLGDEGRILARAARPERRGLRQKSQALLDVALEILESEHPMTLRQLFYRVVSAGALPSTDKKHYQKLGGLMTKVRESREVPFNWMVDNTRSTLKPSSWSGLADFGDTVRDAYRKDFWASLDVHVEVFVEKDAVAGPSSR